MTITLDPNILGYISHALGFSAAVLFATRGAGPAAFLLKALCDTTWILIGFSTEVDSIWLGACVYLSLNLFGLARTLRTTKLKKVKKTT